MDQHGPKWTRNVPKMDPEWTRESLKCSFIKNSCNISLGVFFKRCLGWSFECLWFLTILDFFIVSWVKSNYGLLYFVLCASFGLHAAYKRWASRLPSVKFSSQRPSTGAPPKREDELVRNRDYYPISCPRPSPSRVRVNGNARDWRPWQKGFVLLEIIVKGIDWGDRYRFNHCTRKLDVAVWQMVTDTDVTHVQRLSSIRPLRERFISDSICLIHREEASVYSIRGSKPFYSTIIERPLIMISYNVMVTSMLVMDLEDEMCCRAPFKRCYQEILMKILSPTSKIVNNFKSLT